MEDFASQLATAQTSEAPALPEGEESGVAQTQAQSQTAPEMEQSRAQSPQTEVAKMESDWKTLEQELNKDMDELSQVPKKHDPKRSCYARRVLP